MVHETVECDKRRLVHFTKNANSLDTSRKSRKTTSSKEVKTCCIPAVREKLRNREVPGQAISIITSSWRKRHANSTSMLYKNKWVQFCGERKTSALDPNVNFVLEFLNQLSNRGL